MCLCQMGSAKRLSIVESHPGSSISGWSNLSTLIQSLAQVIRKTTACGLGCRCSIQSYAFQAGNLAKA